MNSNPTAAEIAQSQPRFKKSGDGWMIACPAPNHPGDRSDLNCSVKDGEDGKLLVFCHSHNCKFEDIISGLGLYKKSTSQSSTNNYQDRWLVATYQNEDGNPRKVFRMDWPQDFPDGSCPFNECKDKNPHKHMWQKKGQILNGCYLLLWGEDNPEKTILLVEGEKCAKALQNYLIEKRAEHAGIPACWVGGAKAADKAIYDVCKGRKVILWPDNSNGGKWAMNIAGEMSLKSGATEIKFVSPKGLPLEGDVADVDANEAIKRLINAKPWRRPKQEYYEKRDPETGEPYSKRGGYREGSGRPKSEDPSYKTLSNQRSEERTVLKNWLNSKRDENNQQLPKRFWMDDLVDADVERNMYYNIDKYCMDGKNVYAFYNGVWVKLNIRNEKSIRAITQITLNSRADAARDLGNNYCDYNDKYDIEMSLLYAKELRGLTTKARHCIEIMRTIAVSGNQDIKIVPNVIFDQRNGRPTIPLMNGKTLDLTKYPPVILNPEKVPEDTYILDHDWMIPEPDFTLLESMRGCAMEQAINSHYGEILFTRIASYLLGTDKSIDCFTAISNSGKSTLADILMEALPGAVGMHGAKGIFHKDGQRFTPVATALSTYLITIIDEAGHSSIKISTSVVNEWVQDTIDRERKGEQRTAVRRISSILMFGHTYPHVNFSDQGIKTRFKWAYDGSAIPEMASKTRFLLKNEDQIRYLRAWLFNKAAELWNEHRSTTGAKNSLEEDERIKAAVEIMSESRMDPVSAVLIDNFEEYEHGFVSSSDIDKVLDELDDPNEKPKGKSLGIAITRAFHGSNVRTGRKSINGKQVHGWKGIKHRLGVEL